MSTTTNHPGTRPATGLRAGIVVWFAVVLAAWIAAEVWTGVDSLLLIVAGVVLLAPAQVLWNRTKRS